MTNIMNKMMIGEPQMTRIRKPPKTGSFIAWKKGWNENKEYTTLIKLEVHADAHRIMGTDNNPLNKCRASKVTVLEITNMYTKKKISRCRNYHSNYNVKSTIYRVGQVKEIKDYEHSTNTCAAGIHFFMTKKAAETY